MLKRIFILFIVVVVAIFTLPSIALHAYAAAPGAVTYNRQILERPIMTLLMTQDNGFLNDPDTKDGYLNYGWKFYNGSANGLYDLTYTRYTATHTYSFANGLNKITDIKNRNQLWVGYTLSMCPSRHTKFGSHLFTEKLCYQYTGMYDDSRFYFRYSGGDNDQNVLKNYGSSTNFQKVDAAATTLDIAFGLGGSCTAHGDAYVTDASVYFADRQAPKISSLSVTADQMGQTPKQYFKANEQVYIHLQYDEHIRFCDNSPNHDNVTLALNVARKASASDAGVQTQYATLVELNDTYLTFRYDVPNTISNTSTATDEVTDHYILGIKGSSNQSSFYGKDAFDLKYCYGPNEYTGLPRQYQSNATYVKTNCLITDLAGNPAQTFTDKALNSYCYLDTVVPKIAYIAVEGNMIDKNYTGELDAPDLDRSTVFAGVGDTLTFTAWFSEYMMISSSSYTNIEATLNIKDSSGNPMKLRAVGSGNAKRNVEDKFESAYIIFESMTVDEGMQPIEYEGVDDKCISIASISLLNGLTLSDPSNNAYDPEGVNIIVDLGIIANKKEFLDTLTPAVSTSATLSNEKYIPVFYSSSDSAKFYFPIKPYDDNTAGPAYVSGVSTKDNNGSFEWKSTVPYTFKYKVSGSDTPPADSSDQWSTGYINTRYSFTQITGDNFIHISLIDTVNYNIADTAIVVYPSDFAGNVGATAFELDYIYDSTGPIITPVSYETGADVGTEGSGYINAVIKLEDLSMVDISKVYYRWDDNSTASYVTDWVQYVGSIDESAAFMELEFSLTGLSKGEKHDYNLLIMANDHSSVESGGNKTVMDPGFNYVIDLTYPAYNFSYSTGYDVEPYLKIENLQEKPVTGEDSTVIVMIKDPLSETGNEYFVRTITTGSFYNYCNIHVEDGDVLNHFIFGNVNSQPMKDVQYERINELRLWRYHRVTTDDEQKLYKFDDDAPSIYYLMGGDEEEKLTARRLLAMMGGKYYGDIETTVIAGYGAVAIAWPGTLVYEKAIDPESDDFYGETATDAVYILQEAYPDCTKIFSYSAGSQFVGLDCYEIRVLSSTGTEQIIFSAVDQDGNIIDKDLIVRNYPLPSYIYGNCISYITGTANVDVRTYILKADSADYVLTGEGYQDENTSDWGSTRHPVHDIKLTPTSGDLGIASPWTDPSDGNKFRTSLDDEEFTIDIRNVIIPEWQIKDVDFNSNDTYIGLFLISSPDDGTPVSSTEPLWKTTLADLASQTFRIPADVAKYTGHYQLKVQLLSKGSGQCDSAVVDCYIDKTTLTDFGPKSAEHSFDYTTASGVVTISENYNYDFVTSRIYMGNQQGKEVSLSFGAEAGPITAESVDYRHIFIKAWNASMETIESIAPDNSRWYDISSAAFAQDYEISFYDSAAELESGALGDATNAGLGLIRNTDNLIRYQIAGANGEASAVRTLVIEVSDELPVIEMELTPSSSATNIQSATIFIKKLYSDTMTEMKARTVEAMPQMVGSQGYTITNDKTYAFYTVNAYGNFDFYEVTAPFVDGTCPETTTFTFDGDMNRKNNLGIIFNDNTVADPSQTKLYLKFEQAYMDKLQAISGFEVNSDGYMQVTLPKIEAGTNHTIWTCPGDTATGGIYKVFVSNDPNDGLGSNFSAWLYMDYMYDSTKDTEFNMPAFFCMEDQAGNRSAEYEGIVSVLNRAPTITGITNIHNLNNNLMDIDILFDKPVKVISPDYMTHTNYSIWTQVLHEYPTSEFSFKREAFPIFGEGDYKISFMDIFGVIYTETYTPSIDFSGFGLDVQYSTTELTSEDVTVTIKPQSEGTYFRVVEAPENSVYSELVFNDSSGLSHYLKSASITLSENGHIFINVLNGETRWISIPVNNILSHAPDAVETWYYSQFSSNTLPQGATESTHKVTAFISSAIRNRSIEGAEGCSLSYTFPFGTKAGDSYTFTYTDAVGNIGTKTVYCPVSIVRPLLPQEDKEAPNFTVKVYGKYGEVYKQTESWYSPNTSRPLDEDGNPQSPVTTSVTNTGVAMDGSIVTYWTFKDLLDNMSWTGGYKLVFEVFDSSPTKLVLLHPSSSSAGLTYDNAAGYEVAIEGVSVNGNIVTITNKDAEFKIAVIDDGNEHTLVDTTYQSTPYSSVKEMSFGGAGHWMFDLAPPTAETALEFGNFYMVVGFFRLSDAQSTPTLISPLWPKLTDTASPFYDKYYDWHYKEFNENTTIDINYRDTAYNTSRTTVQVTGIDTSNPKAAVQWWTPSAYSVDVYNGTVTKHSNQPPNHKTNSTVRAGISFDKNITSMKLWLWDGTAYIDVPETVASYATLDQQIDFAVVNFLQDAAVKLTYAAQNNKTGEIVLTLSNVIDKTPPIVTIVDTRNDTDASTKAAFVFSISEDVTDLTGRKYYLTDGQFEKDITDRGIYEYTFTDEAGNNTKVTGTVFNIDGTPPVVIFDNMPDENTSVRGSYTFKAAMNEAGTITMLNQSAIVSEPTDYVDGKPDLETITWHDFTVTQNGSYLVKGTDAAGHISSYYVSINCIDNIAPNITMVPSILRVRQGTDVAALTDHVILSGVTITDNVSTEADIVIRLTGRPSQANIDTVGVYTVTVTATDQAGNSREAQRFIRVYPKNEPEVLVNGQKTDNLGTTVIIGTYDLKISVDIPGFKGEPYTIYIRQGDKTAGQMKRNTTVVEGGTYRVTEDGYYTLYIVRQNREVYLTRLYIQK